MQERSQTVSVQCKELSQYGNYHTNQEIIDAESASVPQCQIKSWRQEFWVK